METIVKFCCDAFRITPEDFYSSCRRNGAHNGPRIIDARHAFLIACEVQGFRWPEIQSLYTRHGLYRGRSGMANNLRRAKALMETDHNFRLNVKIILDECHKHFTTTCEVRRFMTQANHSPMLRFITTL